MRSIRLVASASSPVPSAGYETNANVEKHECSLLLVVSDAGSTPAASTITSNLLLFFPQICQDTADCVASRAAVVSAEVVVYQRVPSWC